MPRHPEKNWCRQRDSRRRGRSQQACAGAAASLVQQDCLYTGFSAQERLMLPFLSMVSASILAGSMVLAADPVAQSFPRFTAAALRFALSSAILIPLALRWGGLP